MPSYYLIADGAIASGPHAVRSQIVRRLTACGNPEALPESALIATGLLPEVRESLGDGQGYGQPVIDGQAVRVPVVDLPPPEPVVPQRVTMRQARAVLILAGLIDHVDAAINAIPNATQRALARNEWERSTVVERDRGLVSQMAPALGLTEAQLDAMFIQAAAIP